MDLTAFQEARIADMTAATEPGRSPWRQCDQCHGRGGVPEQTTLDGLPTGEMHLCPVCLGLGKVTAE